MDPSERRAVLLSLTGREVPHRAPKRGPRGRGRDGGGPD